MAALQARGLRQGLIEQASEEGLEGSDLDWLITYALRRQLDAIARRESNASLDPAQGGEELCVGFVCLSDFTALGTLAKLDAIGTMLHAALPRHRPSRTPGHTRLERLAATR